MLWAKNEHAAFSNISKTRGQIQSWWPSVKCWKKTRMSGPECLARARFRPCEVGCVPSSGCVTWLRVSEMGKARGSGALWTQRPGPEPRAAMLRSHPPRRPREEVMRLCCCFSFLSWAGGQRNPLYLILCGLWWLTVCVPSDPYDEILFSSWCWSEVGAFRRCLDVRVEPSWMRRTQRLASPPLVRTWGEVSHLQLRSQPSVEPACEPGSWARSLQNPEEQTSVADKPPSL